jgi:hypothetical protein
MPVRPPRLSAPAVFRAALGAQKCTPTLRHDAELLVVRTELLKCMK